MAKKKEEYRLGMLWQGNDKDEIESILTESLKYFINKFKEIPEAILVNKSVELKEWENIPLRKDKSMYCKSIMTLMIKEKVDVKVPSHDVENNS